MSENIKKLINDLVDVKTTYSGTIKSVGTDNYDCVITPDGGGADIKNVPISVYRSSAGTGLIPVPKVGSKCHFTYLADGRITLLASQELDKVIYLTSAKLGITADNTVVKVGNPDNATHFAAYGTEIFNYLLNYVYPVIVAIVHATPAPTGMVSSNVKVS